MRVCTKCLTPLRGKKKHNWAGECGRGAECAHQTRRMRGEGKPRSWPWKRDNLATI